MKNLTTKRLCLRKLAAGDATETYASWLNDPAVNRFLEIRHTRHDVQTCREFIEATNLDPTSHLFGIFTKNTDTHIGNIKIGFIDRRYNSAQVSLFIGAKEFWGNGYATEAMSRIIQYGFDDLKLFRLEAGCYEDNLGSLRACLKSGFVVEGFFRKKIVIGCKRTGCFFLGVLRDEWIPSHL